MIILLKFNFWLWLELCDTIGLFNTVTVFKDGIQILVYLQMSGKIPEMWYILKSYHLCTLHSTSPVHSSQPSQTSAPWPGLSSSSSLLWETDVRSTTSQLQHILFQIQSPQYALDHNKLSLSLTVASVSSHIPACRACASCPVVIVGEGPVSSYVLFLSHDH